MKPRALARGDSFGILYKKPGRILLAIGTLYQLFLMRVMLLDGVNEWYWHGRSMISEILNFSTISPFVEMALNVINMPFLPSLRFNLEANLSLSLGIIHLLYAILFFSIIFNTYFRKEEVVKLSSDKTDY